MTSEIDKLKHFYIEDYSGIYFTDELNNGEEFLYTTIGIKDDKEVIFVNMLLKNLNLLDMVMEKVVQMIGCINK